MFRSKPDPHLEEQNRRLALAAYDLQERTIQECIESTYGADVLTTLERAVLIDEAQDRARGDLVCLRELKYDGKTQILKRHFYSSCRAAESMFPEMIRKRKAKRGETT
jgi:hypothetical protein